MFAAAAFDSRIHASLLLAKSNRSHRSGRRRRLTASSSSHPDSTARCPRRSRPPIAPRSSPPEPGPRARSPIGSPRRWLAGQPARGHLLVQFDQPGQLDVLGGRATHSRKPSRAQSSGFAAAGRSFAGPGPGRLRHNTGSFSVTRACSGVLVRVRCSVHSSRFGASKVAIEGYGFDRRSTVYSAATVAILARAGLPIGRACQRPRSVPISG